MRIGSTEIANVKVGSTDINKVYAGSNLVWERTTGTTYEAETIAYRDRVIADGGVVIDIDHVDRVYKKLKSINRLNNLVCWVSSRAGVKKDGLDYVSKTYSLNEFTDLVQTEGSAQPKWGQEGFIFNGGNDKLTAAANQYFNTPTMTLDVRVKHNAVTSTQSYIRMDQAYILQMDSSSRLKPHIYDNGYKLLTASGLIANTWQRAAMTYDGVTLKGFIDETLVGSFAHTRAAYADSVNEFNVGGYISTEGIDGLLEYARMFDVALSEAELIELDSLNSL